MSAPAWIVAIVGGFIVLYLVIAFWPRSWPRRRP